MLTSFIVIVLVIGNGRRLRRREEFLDSDSLLAVALRSLNSAAKFRR